jgi:periplasmic protein TonB
MPTEDAPAEGAPAAGNGPAPVESAAAGYPITFASAAPLHPRWLRPAIASAVILAHALAMVALANVSRPAPPAEETIEVNVIAAGDEAPVTTSAAQPSSEVAAEAKAEQSEAPNGPEVQTPATELAPPAETPPLVEKAPTSPSAPEPSASLDAPPPAAAPQEASPPSPPPDAPPPAAAAQAPAQEPPPVPQPPMSVEAQMQPLPPPPDAPPAAVALQEPAMPPPTPVEAQPQPSPAAEAPPDQVRAQPQPRPLPQARLEPAERPKPQAKPETKPRKPVEGSSSASRIASLSKSGSAEAHHVGEADGRAVDSGMSRASYAALVIAQIQAHRFYPDSARARGEEGAVGVSFTIGPSGRVGSAAVVRSSGFAELDGAAREILRSISPPPPPGGSFSANTTIRFHFE